MSIKIVVDSSSNLRERPGVAVVPLKIVTDEREFVDDATLNTAEMMEYIEAYKGRSGTSCPSVGDWLEAFGDAEEIFTVAITRNLSGCHNAAQQAAQMYLEQHPQRKVCCLDTLTTGPELALIVEKLCQLVEQGLSFGEIQEAIEAYMATTHLTFMLKSVENLAKNGRVSHLVAKAVGFLNIHIVAVASDEGTFQQLHKARGEAKGLRLLVSEMEKRGYCGGKVRITHCFNEEAATALEALLRTIAPEADITVVPSTGLCCFYAERGSVMVGFEG